VLFVRGGQPGLGSRRKQSGAAVCFAGTKWISARLLGATINRNQTKEVLMGRGILLWLLGVPIPIIIIIALLYH
jgi:hypothetical protein